MDKAKIAEIAHNINAAYCRSIGDNSQKTWEEASEHQQASCLTGVALHMDHPDTTPEESRKSWQKEKHEDGWIYGEVKDELLKTHPCMLPYGELPESQRSKDYLFAAIVKELSKL